MDSRSPEKSQDIGGNINAIETEHGHLQELEVDVDKVVHEQEMVVDDDADTSPFPEGQID